VRQRLGDGFRYYRLFYNGVALVTLIPVVFYAHRIGSEPLFSWEGTWRIGQALLLILSLFLFLAGARHYDGPAFLGVRQLKKREACVGLTETCALDTGGILGIVRHPWYAGGILIIWARDLDFSAIISNLILTAYFIVGSFQEERKLSIEFPDTYWDYQQRVSMLFPYQWLKSKLKKQVRR